VEPDPVVGNPADQPDMREAEPWHHALLGEQNGGYLRGRAKTQVALRNRLPRSAV
jgi:hypothetical protein